MFRKASSARLGVYQDDACCMRLENEWASMHGTRAYIPTPLVPMDVDPPFDATGLKEIGNLASWTVSTYKPGCGVEALRDEDTNMFWQYVACYIKQWPIHPCN